MIEEPIIEEEEMGPVAAAGAAATVILSVMISPPLGMFPPQGLPQPTGNSATLSNGGGGSSLASASLVRKNMTTGKYQFH